MLEKFLSEDLILTLKAYLKIKDYYDSKELISLLRLQIVDNDFEYQVAKLYLLTINFCKKRIQQRIKIDSYQEFERLLLELNKLKEENKISEEIYLQFRLSLL